MKQLLKYIIVLLPAFGWSNTYAQKQGQAAIDSMLNDLTKAKEDTNKVKLLGYLSFTYHTINPDTGIKYGMQSLALAKKTGWNRGIALSYYTIGGNFIFKSDFANALEYGNKALHIYEKIDDKSGIAGAISNIGSIYNMQSDHPRALEYLLKALKMYEALNNKRGIADITGNIGTIYEAENDYAKALEYFFKSLKMDEEITNKIGIANVTGNIGDIYTSENDYSKALEYYFNALKMANEIEDNNLIASTTGDIGDVYNKQKNYIQSIIYEQNALKISDEIGEKSLIATQLTHIGESYLSLAIDTVVTKNAATGELRGGKYLPDRQLGINGVSIPAGKSMRIHKAIEYLEKGLQISKEINAPDLTQNCYEDLAEAYKLIGAYKKANECLENYKAINNSAFSKENDEKLVKIEMKYQYDEQRFKDSLKTTEFQKYTLLQIKHQRVYIYISIAGLFLLSGFLFFILKERGKSERERKKSDELLLNILPAEVAKELKINGEIKAKHFDNVTVLFTDFVDFTKAGERLSPQALIDELHTCFKVFDDITGKYNIEKIKTIGDAYLAVGGLPIADPKHAENCVKAAIDINKFMIERQAKLGTKTFETRIGIHTGSVVAGIVGVKKFAYDIWGDTVNTAARMEQNSKPGKINISETTYELVKDKFECEYRGEIEAKNKGKMKMYFVF